MKILAIVGSPRLNGNTNYLVDKALKEAAIFGAHVEKINLSQYKVNPCLGHENCASFDYCKQNDDAGWILDKLCMANGVILATPVYYFNVTAQMKTFIDRNYFLYKHNREPQVKAVGIIVVAGSEGIEDTLHTLKLFIDDSFDISEDRIFIASGYATKPGEAKNNQPLVEKAQKLGSHIVESLKMEGIS